MAYKDDLARLRQGVTAWNDWRAGQPLDLNAAYPDGTDLRGADLSGENLMGANLSRANLAKANLDGANLGGADLRGAHLGLAILTGASLDGADLSRADLLGADLSRAGVRGAHLTGADLHGANLTGAEFIWANLTGADLSRADLSGTSFRGANLTDAFIDRVQWDRAKMRGRYRGIRGLDSCYGNALFKRAAADQDFLDTLEDRWQGSWRIALFWAWGLLDYGRSLSRVAIIAAVLVLLYAAIYWLYPEILNYGDRCPTGFTPIYFSIVTYTTLGFGDVKPATLIGEIIVSTEVVLGYITLGLLLAVLAEKLARRS